MWDKLYEPVILTSSRDRMIAENNIDMTRTSWEHASNVVKISEHYNWFLADADSYSLLISNVCREQKRIFPAPSRQCIYLMPSKFEATYVGSTHSKVSNVGNSLCWISAQRLNYKCRILKEHYLLIESSEWEVLMENRTKNIYCRWICAICWCRKRVFSKTS